MIQTTLRPFTDEERTEILDQISRYVQPRKESPPSLASGLSHAWNGFLYGCAAALILLLLGKPAISAWLCILAAVVIRLAFYLSQPPPQDRYNIRLKFFVDLLRNNEIKESTIIASDVVRVEGVGFDEDETTVGYFFDIGNQEVLFLREESLPFTMIDNNFVVSLPSVFTLTQYPGSEEPVKVTAAGPDLSVSRTLYFVDEDAAYDMEEASIYVASLATLEEDLPDYISTFPTPAE